MEQGFSSFFAMLDEFCRAFNMLHFEKSSNMAKKISKIWRKASFILPSTHFSLRVPKTRVSGTHSATSKCNYTYLLYSWIWQNRMQVFDVLDCHFDNFCFFYPSSAFFEIIWWNQMRQIGQTTVHSISTSFFDDFMWLRILKNVHIINFKKLWYNQGPRNRGSRGSPGYP